MTSDPDTFNAFCLPVNPGNVGHDSQYVRRSFARAHFHLVVVEQQTSQCTSDMDVRIIGHSHTFDAERNLE